MAYSREENTSTTTIHYGVRTKHNWEKATWVVFFTRNQTQTLGEFDVMDHAFLTAKFANDCENDQAKYPFTKRTRKSEMWVLWSTVLRIMNERGMVV